MVGTNKGEIMKIEAGLQDFEDFSPVAPGAYTLTIKKPIEVIPSVDEKTDIGGKLYQFVIRPEIVGGPSAGKGLRRQLSNRSKASRYFLRTFLEKIGVSLSKEGGFNTEDLLGRQFKANVGERAYVDKEGNTKKAAEIDDNSIVAI